MSSISFLLKTDEELEAISKDKKTHISFRARAKYLLKLRKHNKGKNEAKKERTLAETVSSK